MSEEMERNEVPCESAGEESIDTRYTVIGWLAIASAVLILPSFLLGLVLQPQFRAAWPLLMVYVPLVLVQAGLSVYVLYRFRGMLNDRFRFHDVDNLVVVIIMGAVAITVIALMAKVWATLGLLPVFAAMATLALIILIGVPLSVVGIVFAVRLLRLQDDLGGLLRPFAYTTIAACICYVTVLLAPIGGLVDAGATVILGLIFLRMAKGLPQVEFV